MGLLSLRVLTARPVCPTRGSLERRVPARVALLAIMYLMPASSARKRNAVTVQVAQRHPAGLAKPASNRRPALSLQRHTGCGIVVPQVSVAPSGQTSPLAQAARTDRAPAPLFQPPALRCQRLLCAS
jgi:hypothetical protein